MTRARRAHDDRAGGKERTDARVPWVGVVVALVAWLLTGVAWAASSPVGSSPDDDYHLSP